ncbi:MAG: hypothetical protein IJN32_02590, partial [Thermoguttaceae bacterium]|nr:hypothetical protein [Thermoguttaceae bacterium]
MHRKAFWLGAKEGRSRAKSKRKQREKAVFQRSERAATLVSAQNGGTGRNVGVGRAASFGEPCFRHYI